MERQAYESAALEASTNADNWDAGIGPHATTTPRRKLAAEIAQTYRTLSIQLRRYSRLFPK